MITIIRFC